MRLPIALLALGCQLLGAEISAGEEPKVEAVFVGAQTIAISPPNLAARLEPMDEHVHVALAIPELVEPSFYRVKLSELYFNYTSESIAFRSSGAPSANRIILGLAKPVSDSLSDIVHRLFPQTTVYKGGRSPNTEELVFRVEIIPELLEHANGFYQLHGLSGLKVRIRLSVSGAAGPQSEVLEGVGFGSPTGYFLLGKTENAQWRGIATQALVQALNDLIKTIHASQFLRSYLRELKQLRALPAALDTTAHFDDTAALLPNSRLDAGEEARLIVQVANRGPGPAFTVAVQARSDEPKVVVSGDGVVGDLAPGEKKEVTLHVLGRLDLPSEVAKLRIETSEKRGYGARAVLFELQTSRLLAPGLEIVDVTLNDRTGRAKGDGDGQPANGETIEAIVRVRNAGPGDAVGVAVTMASPKVPAEILDSKVVLPRIAADRVEEARLLFRLPLTLQATDLPLSFKAVEARGPQVGSATKDQAWKIRTKRPGVELAYRLYDGNSAGSSGNRDGQVNNGERIEVAVTPANRGDLPARGVRITVESDDPKLMPRPAVLDAGDLPPQAEGVAKRFVFDVPRGYGLDRPAGDLRFTLTVSQQDFPPRREPITLGFRSLRPELSLEAAVPPTLNRGTRGELALRLRNTGPLRAEEVVMEVVSAVSGIDLLDERGVPVQSRKITLGGLDPQASAPVASIPINVRRNALLGAAPLRITVTQKDFSQFTQNASVVVTEEDAAVIAPPPTSEPAPQRPPAFAPTAPATISFLRNTPGEHLLAEAAVLRFEVQSPAELAEVRLTQNERFLPLEGARRSVSAAAGMQLTQFELPVQLEDGENRFDVVVVTRQGLRSTRSLSLFHDREVGRLWVVAIGISKYQDPSIPGLGYADADARAVYEYFRGTFSLPESQVFLRVNEQATLREIKSIVGTLLVAKADDSKDTVILYFAGHGMRDHVTRSLDSDGLSKYFLPYDASRNDLYSTALEMDEVTNILRRLIPDRVVVILDSCFSGAAGGRSPYDPKAAGERAPISDEFLDRMAHVGKGRVVLAASEPEKAAQESAEFGHGVFTYYLLEALHGAAGVKGEENISLLDVYNYVWPKVKQATNGQQVPKLKGDLAGQILIGRSAVHRRR
jgi:uncharacterized caspase-like protein